MVKNLPANAGYVRNAGSIPESGRSPGGRKWQPTPEFLPGESHGQRSLWLQRVRHDWASEYSRTCLYAFSLIDTGQVKKIKLANSEQ